MARYGINGHQTTGRMSSYWKLHGITEYTAHDQKALDSADDSIRDATNPEWDRQYEDNYFSETELCGDEYDLYEYYKKFIKYQNREWLNAA